MAKGKGKSRRRIKNWKARYDHGQEESADAYSRESLANREIKLREDRFAAADEQSLDGMQTVEGMVTGVFRRGTFVRVPGRDDDLFCGIAKTFRPPEGFEHTSPLAVGDDVTVALVSEDHVDGQLELDRNRMDGMILSRGPRETALSRPQPRRGKRGQDYEQTPEKVIAANMDVLLIVAAAAQPPLRPRLIERFLIAAERGEMTPLVVINKMDLGAPPADVLAMLEDLDVEVLRCSAETGEGMAALLERLRGHRCVLAGASGVGKSTLVNAMLPEADAETNAVREKDQRGRHTTSQARVYPLPDNGIVVDTPGIRELGLAVEAGELPWYFPEFEELANECKFRDCTHTHEPSCAVRDAVEAGEIQARRYRSYLRMLDSIDER